MVNGIIPQSWAPAIHAAARIVTGLLFFEHGTSKLFGFPLNENLTGMYTRMGGMLTTVGVIELVGGALLLIGLFTRLTAFVMSGFTAVAFWMVHFGNSKTIFPVLNGGETVVLFCFICLWLSVAGAGPYSVDASRAK